MASHTPGPWGIEYDSEGAACIRTHADTTTPELAIIPAPVRTPNAGGWLQPADREANARLIASAPLLLDALTNLVHFHDNCGMNSSWADAARAAIAAAEGK
jgi:hypothetical protein